MILSHRGETIKFEHVRCKELGIYWSVRTYITLPHTGSRLLIFERATSLKGAIKKLKARVDRHHESPEQELRRAVAEGVEFTVPVPKEIWA